MTAYGHYTRPAECDRCAGKGTVWRSVSEAPQEVNGG